VVGYCQQSKFLEELEAKKKEESIDLVYSLVRARTEIGLWFSRLFQDKITSFSRLFVHLYVNKNITKLSSNMVQVRSSPKG